MELFDFKTMLIIRGKFESQVVLRDVIIICHFMSRICHSCHLCHIIFTFTMIVMTIMMVIIIPIIMIFIFQR